MNHPELPESVTFCGRSFSWSELELMRQIANEFSGLGRTEIARTISELLECKRPSGGLKNDECRRLLERLEDQALASFPKEWERRYGYCPLLLETLVDGHVLSGRQLDPAGRNARAESGRPLPPSGRLSTQADLCLSFLRQRPATASPSPAAALV